MSLLAINGIPFPVEPDSYEEVLRTIGEVVTSYGGAGSRSLYARTRADLTIESVPISDTDAVVWEQLIRGYGERWEFSSFYGSRATVPSVVTGLSLTTAAPNLAGGYKLLIAANSPVRHFTVPINFPSWTVSMWYSTAATALSHYVVTSSGRKWVNGVRNDAAVTSWLSASFMTSLKVEGDLVLATNVDDFVVIPYRVPDSWGPCFYDLFNTYGQQYPATPYLTLSGDAFNPSRTYFGSVSTRVIRVAGGVRRRLSVELTEA